MLLPSCASHPRISSSFRFRSCGLITAQRRHTKHRSKIPRTAFVASCKSDRSTEELGDDDARDGSANASSMPASDELPSPTQAANDDDWRSFRARLIKNENTFDDTQADQVSTDHALQETAEVQWAHQIANPEKGCLLVAKHENMAMFSNTVVLLLEHSDKIGSVGIILNLPMPLLVRDVTDDTPAIKGVFGNQRLFLGGPLRNNTLYTVHSQAGLLETLEVLPGVWCGGLQDAVNRVLDGTLAPKGFRLMAGTSGWGPYQLSNEVLGGSWFVVAASNTVVQDFLTFQTRQEDAAGPVRDRMRQQLLDIAQLTST